MHIAASLRSQEILWKGIMLVNTDRTKAGSELWGTERRVTETDNPYGRVLLIIVHPNHHSANLFSNSCKLALL